MSDREPPLGEGKADGVAAVLRAGAGLVPGIGGPLAELVSQFIPNVRMQRAEDYLRWLNRKSEHLSDEQFRQRLMTEPAMDLVEEGALQAIRALTDQRREQIANAVTKGITGEAADILEAKRMLSLLRQLDEAQIIILASKLNKNQNKEYFDNHVNILRIVALHMQSPREDLDRGTVQQIGRQQLTSLGLLRQRFKKPKKGQAPEMDEKTGMIASSGDEITPLGRLLLRAIGLAEANDV